MKSVDPTWRANWQREIEGVYLYRKLAELSRTAELRNALSQMASQEDLHAAVWEEHIKEVDSNAWPPRPDLRIQLVAWVGRWLGPESVLGFLLSDEVSDIASYTTRPAG